MSTKSTGLGQLAKRGAMPSLTVIIAAPRKEKEEHVEEDNEAESPEERDNNRIRGEAVKALQGKSKRPDEALNEFLETFGRKELNALRETVRGDEEEDSEPIAAARGRMIEGPGHGLADRIKARVGNQPVLLSDGEYVIPADVVSMLGDGSSSAGSRSLEAMIERVRTAKTGTGKQAKPLDRSLLAK